MGEPVFVVVPAFNEGRVIAEVVRELAAYRVVVVDDGSGDDTAAAARDAGATVLRHILNRGQGAALQTGLTYALQSGAQFIVTFDADGQHSADDIPRLLEPLRAGRADVALGSRFRGTTDAPLVRRMTLRAAVVFTRIISGADVTDTHNGLRAFTRAAASRLDLRMDRMAHASETLDQIVGNRLRVEEVPVHVRYTRYSRAKGQSILGAGRILFDYFIGRWLR